jgi:hypothetical protein
LNIILFGKYYYIVVEAVVLGAEAGIVPRAVAVFSALS